MLNEKSYSSFEAAYCDRCRRLFDGQTLLADGASPHLRVCPTCYDPPLVETMAPPPDQIYWPDFVPRKEESPDAPRHNNPVEELYAGAIKHHKQRNNR